MKRYSHSFVTKLIVFIVMIALFTGVVKSFADMVTVNTTADLGIIFEKDYFHSESYVIESEMLINDLVRLVTEYKSEEHILNGGTIEESTRRNIEENLFYEFQVNSRSYNPNLSEAENFEKFKEEYAQKIEAEISDLIKDNLREYHYLLQNIKAVKGILYYASDGTNVFKNSTAVEKAQFETHPSYILYENYDRKFYPEEVEENESLFRITHSLNELEPENHVIYIAYTKEFLQSKMDEWKVEKKTFEKKFYLFLSLLVGFILLFFVNILVAGKESWKDKEVRITTLDRLFVDVNIFLCMLLVFFWVFLLEITSYDWLVPITILFSTLGFVLILSLVKHIKNKTFFTHTLIYQIIYKLALFIKHVYQTGSVGVKTVLIVIGYPILVALTFFIFPITIGFAAWYTYRKVKDFQKIQDGVEKIMDGNLHHRIDIDGKGEFARLAGNINNITDGLNKAVENELKSERLKTELITNVSHDIRTPLTSIITYVDLLKQETDPSKVSEYVEILEQKSQRLKTLTDDLFDAAKASSGTLPVELERINIVSLLTQGLGEVSDKIEASQLDFRMNNPKEKLYVIADGKLMWRTIENVLSNIFKYALKGSRVYIQIEDIGHEVQLVFKNISAYELNISADELMERFKRGDESRTSQGSGLGLSIAKSLVELQKGTFTIEIDGDLFKVTIRIPKASEAE